MSDEFDESDIEALSPQDHIRRRPSLYLPQDSNVRNHLLSEAMCLSLAQAHCGSCTAIDVETFDRSATIVDNGPGLSLERDSSGIAFAERLFTVINACRDHKEHQKIGHQLCGAGIVVVVAVSEYFEATVRVDGGIYRQSYRNGVRDGSFNRIGDCSDTGTRLRFTVAEEFAASEGFDLASLEKLIHAKDIDISGTQLSFKQGAV